MDISPPTEVVLEDESPKGTAAGRPIVLYAAMGIIAVVICAWMFGMKRIVTHGTEAIRPTESKAAPMVADSPRKSMERSEGAPLPSAPLPEAPPTTATIPGNPKIVPDNPGTSAPSSGPTVTYQPSGSQQVDAVDPQEDLELKARKSATTVKFESQAPAPSASGAPVSNLVSALDQRPPAPAQGESSLEYLLRNAQKVSGQSSEDRDRAEKKRQFAAGDTSDLVISRKPASSAYSVSKGTRIPAVIISDVNSQLPGQVEALVRQDVFNSQCGHYDSPCYVEIPKGSKLIGEYNSDTTYAQSRLQVAWMFLIFPDQSTVDLGKMAGYDASGGAGLHDQVDNHWKRLIGVALLTTSISAGVALSQSRNNTPLTYPSAGSVVGASVGQGIGELGHQLTAKNAAIPPTQILRAGKLFDVDTNRELVFDGPYQPIH